MNKSQWREAGLAFDFVLSVVTPSWAVYSSVHTGNFKFFLITFNCYAVIHLLSCLKRTPPRPHRFSLCHDIFLICSRFNEKVCTWFWDSQTIPRIPGAELIVQELMICSYFGKEYFLTGQKAALLSNLPLSSVKIWPYSPFSKNEAPESFWISL